MNKINVVDGMFLNTVGKDAHGLQHKINLAYDLQFFKR